MKNLIFLFVLIFSLSLVSAADISITHQIFDNKVLTDVHFQNGGNFNGQIPRDVKTIETKLDYILTPDKILEISSTDEFKFSYISNALIDKSNSKNFFTFSNPISQKSDVRIFLPEGSFLADEGEFVFPKNYELSTDGLRIIVEYKNFQGGEIILSYQSQRDSNFVTYLLVFLLILSTLIIFLFIQRRKRKVKNPLVENFLNDREKNILDVLQKQSPLKQSRLSKLTDIPKASLSRHVQQLEIKKLIKRSGDGKNKIIFLK